MGKRDRDSGLIQRKNLSQVFLRTEWPVHKLVERVRSWQVSRVLEIGPGGGVLTKGLLGAGLKVTAVEKDPRFAERLVELFNQPSPGQSGSLEVVGRDILKFDFKAWIQESKEPSAIVGNIPYAISTPILIQVLDRVQDLRGIALMVQLEFAQRILAQPDSKLYGSLSVYTQLRSKPELIAKVDRNAFHPVPKVDSALIAIGPKPQNLSAELLLKVEKVTRSCFNQRRKILRNALKPYLSPEKEALVHIDLGRRPETLWPEDFVHLAQVLF